MQIRHFFFFFFSPFIAPGDQNALRQQDVFGAKGETWTKNFGSSYYYLPTYTYDTRATLEQKSWTLLEKTISEITSSVGKHSSHGYLLYSLPSGMPKYPLLRIISQMRIFYLWCPNSINTVFGLLFVYLGKSAKHIFCIMHVSKMYFFQSNISFLYFTVGRQDLTNIHFPFLCCSCFVSTSFTASYENDKRIHWKKNK